MRQQATANDAMVCGRCNGMGRRLSPPHDAAITHAVYSCSACGNTYTADGRPYAEGELRNFFRGATLGHEALNKAFGGTKLPPQAMVLLQAQLLEYGTNMWFDGLKQGLLLGAVSHTYREKNSGEVRPTERPPTPAAPGRGARAHAQNVQSDGPAGGEERG